MQALVGKGPFRHGREQMNILAGREVTAKSVNRTAEGMGPMSHNASKSRCRKPCVGTAPRALGLVTSRNVVPSATAGK